MAVNGLCFEIKPIGRAQQGIEALTPKPNCWAKPRARTSLRDSRALSAHSLKLRDELPGLSWNPVGAGFSGDVCMPPVEGTDLGGIALFASCEVHAQVVA